MLARRERLFVFHLDIIVPRPQDDEWRKVAPYLMDAVSDRLVIFLTLEGIVWIYCGLIFPYILMNDMTLKVRTPEL